MEFFNIKNDSYNDTQTVMMNNNVNTKTFLELCDIIKTARQCVSIEFDSQEHILKQKISQVLKFLRINATVLTKEDLLLPQKDKVSNVILCLDNSECLFINIKFRYIIHYSPNNEAPNLLIHRFLSIYYTDYQLISLFNESNTNIKCKMDDWMLCVLFTSITSIHRDYTNTELIDILSKQYNDNEFLLNFQDLCNVVSSNQTMMCKIDLCRPKLSYTKIHPRVVSQNMNKILEILHHIVSWCCMSIKTDEKTRNNKLYCNLINCTEFEKIKKHIKISKTMVYETILKLWNRLNYELTLNINNVELIKQTFKNIVHCWNVHYKYVIFVLINLVQCNSDANSIINTYSYTIVSLTEEYDEKIREVTILADSMNELISEVLK